MNQKIRLLTAAALLVSCASGKSAAPTAPVAQTTAPAQPAPPAPAFPASADQAFQAFSARFIDEYLRRNPTSATEFGDHSHDGEWPDLSRKGDKDTRAFIAAAQDELRKLPRQGLDRQNAVDVQIIENQLGSWLFSLDEVEGPVTNPLVYTGLLGSGIDPLLTRSFAPHAERMRSLLSRLRGVPALVAAAKERLTNPPRVYTETAIEQNRGLIHLVDGGLGDDIAQEKALSAELTAAARQAAAALGELQIFFEKDLLPRSTGDFRIGRALFEKKLRFALEDEVDPEGLVRAAREEIGRTHEEMLATASELWPSVLPHEKLPAATTPAARQAIIKQVLDALAKDRPTNQTIVQEATRTLEEATAFVRAHDLVTVPSEPCRVVEMPEYKRGVAVAYCEASGPLEQHQETVVAISPTPSSWTPERVQSFYREYNRSMLADLIVHEAMPGHFLQAMHANKFKSPVRSIFASGPFGEGWAVYGEWLLARNGFGGPKVRLERQKMILRTAVNLILDHDIHAGAMTEKEALALMMNEAFQEEGEAVGKWRRARLSSTQLSTYYYGFSELVKLRKSQEKAPGFSERAWHDKLLSFGSPAPRYLRELMR